LILQNETDVLKTYQLGVNLNSSGMTSQIQDVDTLAVQNCDASYNNNSKGSYTLLVTANVNELPATTTIQWGIITNYSLYSGMDLVASSTDIVPDQGLQVTAITR
jgi:hypothetical protein